ncbi:MAG: hypothetical protein ACOYL6_03920 [Bacteriovoracaceae bacterium]
MWLRMLKVLALIFFCFYPWWLVSILFHPWYGPLAALIFTSFCLVFLKTVPDLVLLSLLKAREQRKSRSHEAYLILKKIAFDYRMPMPKLYFTYKGTRNIYALYRGKQSTLVVHENCLSHLTAEEFHAVFSWLLSPVAKKMLKRGTFINALVTFSVLPFVSLSWFFQRLNFLPEIITDGPKASLDLMTIALIEIGHSIFYDKKIVTKNDLKIKAQADLGSALISALGKLEQSKEPFSWSEKILLSNRFSQTKHHVRIFSLLTEYSDPEHRIEVLKTLDVNP